MNVLIMADYRTSNSGNFIASLLELAIEMKKRNYKVIFAFPDNREGGYSWSKWLENNGFTVFLLSDEGNVSLNALKTIIKEMQIDLIHSHFGYKHRLLIENYKKLGNVKILFHDHMDFSKESSLLKQKIRCWIYAIIYKLLGIGVVSVMEKKNKSYFFAGKHQHWYVPNGISMLRSEVIGEPREILREQLGITKDEKLCLFLGWDLKRKGLDTAIKAVYEYRKKSDNLVLGVIGLGCNPSKNAIQFIEDSTDICAESDWIKYFNSVEDIFAYHRAADVYLSASRSEAFSYGILEAISQNRSVVVSDIEGTSWSWKYNKSIIFPVEDSVKCASALEKALNQQEESNYQDIIEEYSIRKWCERILEIYEIVIK